MESGCLPGNRNFYRALAGQSRDVTGELRLLPRGAIPMQVVPRREPVEQNVRILERHLSFIGVIRRHDALDSGLDAGALGAVVGAPLAFLPHPLFRAGRIRQGRPPERRAENLQIRPVSLPVVGSRVNVRGCAGPGPRGVA